MVGPLVLAIALTVISAFLVRAFFRQSRNGVISTKMGEVERRTSPRHYAILHALSVWLFLPLAGLMLLALWIAAIAKLFA